MTVVARKKIAIIGSGISGLLSGYLLSRSHDVTVFEAANEIGGHTATKIVAAPEGNLAVDTGFIVFNDRTYPNFLKLLAQLGVAYQSTEMGFSVACQQTGFEYSGTSLNGIFAQRKNIFDRKHWRMLKEIVRFNTDCTQLYKDDALPEVQTLGEYLELQGYSEKFIRFYILPMVSAIWSSPMDTAANMPLVFFIRFFHNHGLLTVTQQPQWYTIKGGSHQYLRPLTENYKNTIYTNCPVLNVKRNLDAVAVTTARFGQQFFDDVIFACHSDQALKLLVDPSPAEYDILSAIPYQSNQVVLHSDIRLLPRLRRSWASWNYMFLAATDVGHVNENAALTYNMNILQKLNSATIFCVSVNAGDAIDPEKIYGEYHYSHPMFTRESVAAQARWAEISGKNHTHFCGAYWRNGFHEDGVVSAIRVAEVLGEIW
ncbi:NAD(P)/FAD-dependent oxidoreductase [Cellvibrio sp. OA-2007]|uniref:NAD(P)/FAD-dependent oxidoreductase n=1 Tax=Cellvibrio sp. OA-2007 TaxID=529823 RepID=UPI0007853109|nr:FAD-dependent oxidoreductase [Cellvibrio sp. OA-2007]